MGRIVEGMKALIKNTTGKEVDGNTKGEIFEKFSLQYKNIALALAVVDSDSEDIATPIIALKTGAVVGSGDAVSAESDGTYTVKYGTYNYSISKTGYQTVTGTLTFGYDEAEAGEASAEVVLLTPAILTIAVTDGTNAITGSTIVLKKGDTIGSGDVVTAEANGTYKCLVGDYNYSVSKATYDTETGVIEITAAQLETVVTQTVTLTLTT